MLRQTITMIITGIRIQIIRTITTTNTDNNDHNNNDASHHYDDNIEIPTVIDMIRR